MAEFHDYRENARDIEDYDLSVVFNGENINLILDDFLFIKLKPQECRQLINGLYIAIRDYKKYAAEL